MHRLLIKRKLLVLLSSILFIDVTYAAQDQHSQQKSSEPKPAPKIKKQYLEDNEHWIESLHDTVSNSVFQSAVWFDKFFLDEENEQTAPKTTARIRLGWEPKARDFSKFDARFRIKVRLPHFQNKVDLILSDDQEADQSQLPLESFQAKPDAEDENFSASLRFTHSENKDRLVTTRVGLSGGDIFLRSKLSKRFYYQDKHSIKVEPSIYYFLDEGLGARLLMEYDYQLSDTSQLRIDYSVRGSESFSGLRWKHGFYHLRQFDNTSAGLTGIEVEGERNGERSFIIDEYKLYYRYRFNAVRKWLFFEIEPFVEFPEVENYSTTPGLALRVEGYFSKK